MWLECHPCFGQDKDAYRAVGVNAHLARSGPDLYSSEDYDRRTEQLLRSG